METAIRLVSTHSGLYSKGRLIHGQSIHGEAPGYEGENLRGICEALARKMEENGDLP
jgi:hypothetical protein